MTKDNSLHVNARQNSDFSTCEFRSLTKYILEPEKNIRGGNNKNNPGASHVALIVEKTLVRAYEHFKGGIPIMSWEFLYKVFVQVWNETIKNHRKTRPKVTLTDEHKSSCIQCLEQYFNYNYCLRTPRARIEQSKCSWKENIKPKLRCQGIDYKITGEWDRLLYSFELGGLIVEERKVKSIELTDGSVEAEMKTYQGVFGNIQLGQYAYMLSLMYPGVELNLARLILITPDRVCESTWDVKKIETLKKEALLSSENYINKFSGHLDKPYDFKAKKNAFCSRCNIKKYCLTWCDEKKIAVNPIPEAYFERITKTKKDYSDARESSRYNQLSLLDLIEAPSSGESIPTELGRVVSTNAHNLNRHIRYRLYVRNHSLRLRRGFRADSARNTAY